MCILGMDTCVTMCEGTCACGSLKVDARCVNHGSVLFIEVR